MATEVYPATTHRYDVFLSHTSGDKDAVERIARRLRAEAQLEPFLDRWHLIPGNAWQEELEQALNQSRTCVVFLGPADLGPWENEEMRLGWINARVTLPFVSFLYCFPTHKCRRKDPCRISCGG
jgi:TIR domain